MQFAQLVNRLSLKLDPFESCSLYQVYQLCKLHVKMFAQEMQGMNFIVEADKMRKYNCILGYIIYSVK
jgi:hypothetical protein